MRKWVFIAIIALFCLSLVGCSVYSSASEATASLPFDGTKAKAGDRIGGMKVTKVQDVVVDEEGLLTAYIDFKGEVTVTGTYIHHNKDAELIGPAVSFEPDVQSIEKIPQLQQSNRVVWFLLSNYEEASKIFGPAGSTGKATITIDNYKINFAPIAAWDTAELVNVVDIEK